MRPVDPTPTPTPGGEVRVVSGQVLGGKYRVTRLIGRGGMGIVVEAQHVELGERVAVKILHARHLDNAEAVARFHHESRAAARVRGEHSVRMIDVGTTDEGCPFLVMEMLVGADLASLVEEGPVPLTAAALYVLQACEGMAEVHAHGIVHRDLKPANLFLATRPDGSPVVKVLDFGIAKGVAAAEGPDPALTQTLVSMGTPLYMSPEQIRSSRHVDARADVWSLGAIFYELVVGRPAFGGNTVTAITAHVLEGHPTLPTKLVEGLPSAVDEIVVRALEKRPDDRYVDVASLAAALEPLAGAAGAGGAARTARVLGGALRPESTTTPPVARDDALGGTIRFDRHRRQRAARLGVGVLAFLALGLVIAAFGTYRAAQPELSASARQGVRPHALVPAAVARAAEEARRAAPTPDTGRVIDIDAEPAFTDRTSPAEPPPRTRPTAAPGTPSAAPTLEAAPAPTPEPERPAPPPKPFDPFADRN